MARNLLPLIAVQYATKRDKHGDKLRQTDQLWRDDLTFVDEVASLKQYWINAKQRRPFLFKLVQAYFSIPVASSKSETTFSYSGAAVTKVRNRLGVELTEALTVYNDFTRQGHFSFPQLREGVHALAKEYELVKQKKKEERERRLVELLDEIANDKE